ncbi:hypothetical protein SRHO_G00183970 [Serrasalmus rhombeus]
MDNLITSKTVNAEGGSGVSGKVTETVTTTRLTSLPPKGNSGSANTQRVVTSSSSSSSTSASGSSSGGAVLVEKRIITQSSGGGGSSSSSSTSYVISCERNFTFNITSCDEISCPIPPILPKTWLQNARTP